MILLVACGTVLVGTLFPVLSEYVQGTKTTMGAPYYNRVNLPIGLFLLMLTGVGPLLAWRSTSLRAIRKNFILPGAATALALVVLMIAGVRPWAAGDDELAVLFALIAFSLAFGVITAISMEFLRGANVVRVQTGDNLLLSAATLMRRNTRRYGGYLVHFGIVVMFIGIAGGAFNQSKEQVMGFGDTLRMGPYVLRCQSFTSDSNPNYDTDFALLDVTRGGKFVTTLSPEKRIYFPSTDHPQSSTVVALHSTALSDLYVINMGRDPETDRPIVKAFLNPLVVWIWIGVVIVIVGTLFALVPNVVARRREARAAATVPAEAAAHA